MAQPTIPTQGVHHITLTGADRQTSIDFWEGVLGMPFVFEQPNLDDPSESHLYFDPGDGRLITVFTHEARQPEGRRTPVVPGAVHHLAFAVSSAVFDQVADRLAARGIDHSGPRDRGFMDSIYFTDPLGLLIELACYRFDVPEGHRVADVMIAAHPHPGCGGRKRHRQGAYRRGDRTTDGGTRQPVAKQRTGLTARRAPPFHGKAARMPWTP
jgi:glyoxalase family protein